MNRFVHFGPAALILLGGAALFLWQRQTTHRLQREIAVRREALRELPGLRAENEKRRELLAVSDDAGATGQVKAEITRLRQELTTLEQKRSPAPRREPPPVRWRWTCSMRRHSRSGTRCRRVPEKCCCA